MQNDQTTVAAQGEVAATTPAKKVQAPAKKKAPAKKAAPAKKVVPAKKKTAVKAEAAEAKVLKATSIAEAIKMIKKDGLKLGVISVNGKKYSFTQRSSWAISKNLVKQGVDGLIMVIKEEGHYVYPAKEYKNLFGKIMKSNTWAEIGSYSQSVLPQWHSEYFTELK